MISWLLKLLFPSVPDVPTKWPQQSPQKPSKRAQEARSLVSQYLPTKE